MSRCFLPICLIALLGLAGCALETEFTIPADLPPVMTDQPMYKFALQPPDDVKIEPQRVYRGVRGGVLLLSVTGATEQPALRFDPTKIRIQLSSGQFRRPMLALDFEEMCSQFGAESYGITQEIAEEAGRWPFPYETETCVLKPGERKEVALAFGAEPQEQWVTLEFDAALARPRFAKPANKLLVAVMLPEVLPPKKPWLPKWLHFGFYFANAG